MLYPIAIERGDSTTAHGVMVPDIPGCFSAGDSYDEAVTNAIEAITGHLECLADDGQEIPLATNIESHIDKSEFVGMTWALVPVDVSRYLGKSQKINVTMPSRLIHLIDAKVASNTDRYKNRSAYLASLAEKELISRETECHI